MKLIKTAIYGIVALAGLFALWGLVTQPNFGLAMSNLWNYALALIVLIWGADKLLKIDLVKKISVI